MKKKTSVKSKIPNLVYKENKSAPKNSTNNESKVNLDIKVEPITNIVYQDDEKNEEIPFHTDNGGGESGKNQTHDNKIWIEIKPRENYLNEKISKSGLDSNIIKCVSLGWGRYMNNIHKDITHSNWTISSSRNLTISSPRRNEPGLSSMETKTRRHIIKELKKLETSYGLQWTKVIENEKLIKDEELLNANTNGNSVIEGNKRQAKLKEIKSTKERILNKIDEIGTQINILISRESNKTSWKNKKKIIQQFLENFERDKEIITIRTRKYLSESRSRSQKMGNDIQELCERRKREIEENEREQQLRKEEKLREMYEKDREMLLKRTKENNQKILKVKVFVNDKPQMNEHEYCFNKQKENYIHMEELTLQKENNKRKILMRSIPREELYEFEEKYKEEQLKSKSELEKKSSKLNKLWRERKELVPKYKSHWQQIIEGERIKEKNKYLNIKNEKENKIKIKMEYSEQVKQEHIPTMNQKLQSERLEIIEKLQNKGSKLVKTKSSYYYSNTKGVLIKKNDPNKPSQNSVLKTSRIDETSKNNNNLIKEHLIKRPKPIHLTSSSNADWIMKLNKHKSAADIKIRNVGTSMKDKTSLTINNSNVNNWEKVLQNNKSILPQKIEEMKTKIRFLENDARNKEQFIRLNGGIEKFPELSEKVTNLYLDSIKAKLSILDTVANKDKY